MRVMVSELIKLKQNNLAVIITDDDGYTRIYVNKDAVIDSNITKSMGVFIKKENLEQYCFKFSPENGLYISLPYKVEDSSLTQDFKKFVDYTFINKFNIYKFIKNNPQLNLYLLPFESAAEVYKMICNKSHDKFINQTILGKRAVSDFDNSILDELDISKKLRLVDFAYNNRLSSETCFLKQYQSDKDSELTHQDKLDANSLSSMTDLEICMDSFNNFQSLIK